MKKKLTVNTLALGNLKQRKKQYTTLLIGIILAMFFSSSIIFFISCLVSSNEEYKKRTYGNSYAYFYDPQDYVDIEQEVKNGYIEQYGYAHITGYAYTDEEKKDLGTPVAWLDDDAKELYYAYFEEGRYPENKGEIAIEKDALLLLGIDAAVGDEITLSVLIPDGTDFLPDAYNKTYTLVGILSDKRKNIIRDYEENFPPMAAAFVSEKEEIENGGKEILALYFNPVKETLKANIAEDLGDHTFKTSAFSKYFVNKIYENLRKDLGENVNYPNFKYMLNTDVYGGDTGVYNSSFLTITLASVLMLASCIGIINAFTANLGERKKQIGMLRAVGATRRQIINIFGREAFIITLICTPVCVALSYFGVKLFAYLMGDAFIFLPNLCVLFGSAGVSVICVMLAALIPLFSASGISPMQAIRNVELGRRMKRKKIKSQSEFNVSSLLAKRSLDFYKSKQVGVSIILTITILLTCFGFSFLTPEMEGSTWYKYNSSDYVVWRSEYPSSSYYVNMPEINKGITQNNIQTVFDYPLFENVYGSTECISYIVCDEYSDYMKLLETDKYNGHYLLQNIDDKQIDDGKMLSADELIDFWFDSENPDYLKLKNKLQTDKEMFKTEIYGYDSQIIESNMNKFEVIDGNINIRKLNSGEEIILVASEEICFSFFNSHDHILHTVSSLTDEYVKENGDNIHATAKLNYKAGDKISLKTLYSANTEFDYEKDMIPENTEVADREVTIGAIINTFSFGERFSVRDDMGILTTADGLSVLTGHEHDYEILCIDFKGENDDATDKTVTEYLNSVFAGSDFSVSSGYRSDKDNESILRMVLIAMISVIILFFAISASIVNNALTAKIRESKREIGTLRAVGASARELTLSYIKQFFSMFVWGCGFGFCGYGAGYLILKIFVKSVVLYFEIWQAALICVLLLLICSFNLYFNIKKQMKNSIVENIMEL